MENVSYNDGVVLEIYLGSQIPIIKGEFTLDLN